MERFSDEKRAIIRGINRSFKTLQSTFDNEISILGDRIRISTRRGQLPLGEQFGVVLSTDRKIGELALVVMLVMVDQGLSATDDLQSFVRSIRRPPRALLWGGRRSVGCCQYNVAAAPSG